MTQGIPLQPQPGEILLTASSFLSFDFDMIHGIKVDFMFKIRYLNVTKYIDSHFSQMKIASHRPVFYVHVWMNFLIILLKYVNILFQSSRRIPFYIMVGLQPLTTIPAINQPVMTNVVFSSSPVLTSHNQG